jgi:hypothetical protein
VWLSLSSVGLMTLQSPEPDPRNEYSTITDWTGVNLLLVCNDSDWNTSHFVLFAVAFLIGSLCHVLTP